jgi:hypothetical protein
MNWLLQLFGGGLLGQITDRIGDAYEAKLNATTDKAKLETEETLAYLEAQRALLLEEQKRWLTAWIRPAIAFPVVVYIWKTILWDTVLQWGVTPYPGDFVNWTVITVIGAYMLTRPFEIKR